MAASNFEQYLNKNSTFTSREEIVALATWKAAWKAAEEKFTSTNTGSPKSPPCGCQGQVLKASLIADGNNYCPKCGRRLRPFAL